MAKTVRDCMTPDCNCIGENETILDAAKRMKELDVGSLPICGDDDRLKGMLTDRDIVVKALAEGRNATSTTAGELAQGKPVWIDVNASPDDALRTMAEHKIRRLPVIDDHKLVGIVSQGDLAQAAEERLVGETVEQISTAP